jgi:hypothetical protein
MQTIVVGGKRFRVLFPDLLLPLTAAERAGLRQKMQASRRVEVAVIVDENNGIIDGINRLTLAAELGITDVPLDVRAGLTLEQKRDLAITVNTERRHLSQEEKREAIARQLKAQPERSNRQVAAEVGVDHKTVATVRENLEATGEIPQLERTEGADGKSRPASRPASPSSPPTEPFVELAEGAHQGATVLGANGKCPRLRIKDRSPPATLPDAPLADLPDEVRDVLEGRASFAVVHADLLSLFRVLPAGSCNYLLTSVPYEDRRDYGMRFNLKDEAFVAWVVEIVRAALIPVIGMVSINLLPGITRDHRNNGCHYLIAADLLRTSPPVAMRRDIPHVRYGRPGSGGGDWFRNDWEPVLNFTRGGPLPWSDQTACGKPPKYKPGGAFTYNRPDGSREYRPYKGVAIANPGDVLFKETYTRQEVAELLGLAGDVVYGRVGGGRMGDELAHQNEAAMTEDLPARLIPSLCPPGGIVIDSCCGSGTTGAVAVKLNRRFLGCDIRLDQVKLAKERISKTQPDLFSWKVGEV